MSVSLLLGLTLLIQPTPLFPHNVAYPTVPASPIDLPPIGTYNSLHISLPFAYFAAFTATLFMVISLGLLSRAVKITIYHSMASNSLVTALLSMIVFVCAQTEQTERGFTIPPARQIFLLLGITFISIMAHLFQALAFQRKSPRQLSLVGFLQPIFSTGFQTIFLDRSIDVLPLAGSVLIAANV